MTPLFRTLAAVLLLSLVALSSCSEKKESVDLNAQVAALSGDAEKKITALAEMGKLGPGAASAVPKVIPLLKDPDPVVRRTAAYVLGAVGPAAKAALPDLKAMLQTDDRDQLTAVGNALRAIEPEAMKGVKINNVSN